MANEASFRSALNGFNKTDVMNYIEGLLLKASESAGVEASLRAKVEELEKKLVQAIADSEKYRQEKIEAVTSLEAAVEAEKKARLESEKAKRESETELEKARIALYMKTETTVEPAKVEEKLLDVDSSISDVCSDCEKAKFYEAQLGAAMLDAKRFSEILVKEANDKVADLLDNAGKCAADASKKALHIADEVKKLSNNFNMVYSQLYKQMNSLAENLDCFTREAETNGVGYCYHTEFAPCDIKTAE